MNQDLDKIFEKVKKKNSPILFDGALSEVTKFYLLFSHILENFGKGLSLTKVRGLLMMRGFPENEIMEVEKRLKDSGLILPKKGKSWFRLHGTASEFCKRMLDIENRKELISYIIKKASDIKYSRVKGKVSRNKISRIGVDMAIYVDHGEADRVTGLIKNYKTSYKLGGFNKCSHAYIIHAPTTKKEFLKKVYKEIESISTNKPEFIEVESWYVEKFNESLNPMINTPRRHLDILFSAMPRIAVISLFMQINLNDGKYEQNWIYNEAYKYNYGKGKVIESFETKTGPKDNYKLVAFGENYSIRFQEMLPVGFYEYEANYMGLGNSNNVNREYPINMKSHRTMKELKIPNVHRFTVDYLSPYDVFNQLYYIQPTTIFVSGNRVVALGIAQYFVYCLKNPDTMKTPKIISEHVSAENYSKGIGSLNISVFKNYV